MKSIVLFLVVFGLMTSAMAEICGESSSVELMAGQHIDAGHVEVSNDGDYLYVKYVAEDGWELTETHLAVECSLGGIPTTNKGSPVPGQFEYGGGHDSVTEYTYTIPLEGLECESIFIAAHAVVEKEDGGVLEETAWGNGTRFVEKGNWGMYFQYDLEECDITITFPEDGTAYIGYEDRQAGDFDYNDFGMNMYVQETYVNGYLSEITLEFEALVRLAGDRHDIHILRELSDDTEYDYTVTRSDSAQGTETAEGTYSGSGDLDVVLFDTNYFSSGDTVTINVEITSSDDMYNPGATPPRFDLEPLFAFYDPWMNDKSIGNAERHIDDVQAATTELPTQGYDVPYIIVVPVTDWPAPGEQVTVTDIYGDFDNYYRTQDSTYEDWYI